MTNVALFDNNGFGSVGSTFSASVDLAIGGTHQTVYVGALFYRTTAQAAGQVFFSAGDALAMSASGGHSDGLDVLGDGSFEGYNDFTAPAGSLSPNAWHLLEMYWDLTSGGVIFAIDGVSGTDHTGPFLTSHMTSLDLGMVGATIQTNQGMYVGEVWVGTDGGLNDILLEDWSGGTFANWTHNFAATIVSPPAAPPTFAPTIGSGGVPIPPLVAGRVLIAFDDLPLAATPTWTALDQGGAFPASFVSGYDLISGRQTLLAQTDTGTATVYINDHEQALFDPRNVSSPYFGKLDGRQIKLQLYDPVRAVWESQFQGHIDEVTYDIDGSAADANGDPINASIQINCVDIFDYLAGYGLTPGLNGVMPTPVGGEDGVWYAETASFVDDRITEILTDVGIDPTRYVVFSGNVRAREVKYDPDESAMVALRDASDAEFPFIANMYVDRFGRYCWHGRYGRFDPSGVSSDAGTARWDWHDWKLGDGKAILADSSRTQIRVLDYVQARNQIVNVAVCYPQGMKPAQMPSQVYADTTSITNYGKFSAPPMSDLLVKQYIGPGTALDANAECLLYAELLVKNQKDPRVSISAIQLKSISPADTKAANVWACLTQCDISDLVNVKVGYPSGTGLAGASPTDDYFVEGRQMRVRPAQASFDYVELDLNLSPFVWSADSHSVFPARA